MKKTIFNLIKGIALMQLSMLTFVTSSFAQQYSLLAKTVNQFAVPTNDTSNVSQDSLVNSILFQYNVTKYKKAYRQETSQEFSSLYRIICTGNGDSLKCALLSTGLFDSVTNFGALITGSGCASPTTVVDPVTLTMDNWAIENVDAKCAWTITKGDPRVNLAYADTEFDELHEDLVGKYKKVVIMDPSITTRESHGTKMSGLVLANTNNHIGMSGLGYNMKASGYTTDGSDLGDAVAQAYYDGNRVINISWNSTANSNAFVENMTNHGAIIVVCAGNSPSADWHKYQANIPGVINVSSINYENKIGPPACARNTWVDLCAPGSSVLRPVPRWDFGYPYTISTPSSTSSAASYVSGTVALMLSINPCLSPKEVEYILKQTADPIVDNSTYPGLVGAGRLNTYKAVKFAQEVSCMNIVGIDINTICRPGKVAGVPNPQFTVKMEGGTPPYKYKWESIDYTPGAGIWNTTTLDNYTIGNPTVISSTTLLPTGYHIAYYRLIVTDASAVEKMAIKTIKVVLSNSLTPIVAVRDSYMDMLREPNDQADVNPYDLDIWASPDVWNRHILDGVEAHQDPEYFIAPTSNFIYTRVHNYGCVASLEGQKLRLYWSKLSTGEKWEADWKTANVAAAPSVPGGLMPGGREITDPVGISIPALAPCSTSILTSPWFPPHPQSYAGEPDKFDACVLARIEKLPTYPFGMTFPEISGVSVTQNVRFNNTIATRNFILTNLDKNDFRRRTRDVIVGNADNVANVFNLRFEIDRPIYPGFGGDFSTRGSIVLHLGSLYDRWVSSGAIGEFTASNAQAKTVTLKGSSLIELKDINFAPDEKFTISVEFILDTTITIVDSSFQRMYLRQYLSNDSDSLYGSVGYELKIKPSILNLSKTTTVDSSGVLSNESFKLSPNPTDNLVEIKYSGKENITTDILVSDIMGKIIIKQKSVSFETGGSKLIDLANQPPGFYLISVSNALGVSYKYKVLRK